MEPARWTDLFKRTAVSILRPLFKLQFSFFCFRPYIFVLSKVTSNLQILGLGWLLMLSFLSWNRQTRRSI